MNAKLKQTTSTTSGVPIGAQWVRATPKNPSKLEYIFYVAYALIEQHMSSGLKSTSMQHNVDSPAAAEGEVML